jgi:hypothetical protein
VLEEPVGGERGPVAGDFVGEYEEAARGGAEEALPGGEARDIVAGGPVFPVFLLAAGREAGPLTSISQEPPSAGETMKSRLLSVASPRRARFFSSTAT